ncbi:hypothetical protein [Nocardioides daejeonensis]|uniref:hypothetical protein n=1 Tax=Nocardioides daejeonensis TaxID=1046556 RepID=UPI0013A58DE2|nr:hypothetical protein [Nocardioides daejeonensis]
MPDLDWPTRIEGAFGDGPQPRGVADDLEAGRRALRRRRRSVMTAVSAAAVATVVVPMAFLQAHPDGDAVRPAFAPTSSPSAVAPEPGGQEIVLTIDDLHQIRYDRASDTLRLPEKLRLLGDTTIGNLHVFEVDLGDGQSLYFGARTDARGGVAARDVSGHLDAQAELLAAARPDAAPRTVR